MTIETSKFARKPFYVDAVQVTEENMEEVAEWCGGKIQKTPASYANKSKNPGNYIKVQVNRPLTERQTRAFVGDWVLFGGVEFKVYTPVAFENSFEPASAEAKNA